MLDANKARTSTYRTEQLKSRKVWALEAAYLFQGPGCSAMKQELLSYIRGKPRMAESQGSIVYDANLVAALRASLSESRLAPYLVLSKGDPVYAFRLYLWNSRLCKAFLFPLNIAEVTTRNSVYEALSIEFGTAAWIQDPGRYGSFTAPSLHSHKKSLDRLRQGLNPGVSIIDSQIVAGLTFDFWSNLFRKEYTGLWKKPGLFRRVFPNAPRGMTLTELRKIVQQVNTLRNRIAHHEPIHNLNLHVEFSTILMLIKHQSADTATWVRKCSTVMSFVRSPPGPVDRMPGLPLAAMNHRTPVILPSDTSLETAILAISNSHPAVALVDTGEGELFSVTAGRILGDIRHLSETAGGMIDLSEHTLADMHARQSLGVVSYIPESASSGDALLQFFDPDRRPVDRPDLLVVRGDAHRPIGIILHPIVKYI